jgi:hypothetical protein
MAVEIPKFDVDQLGLLFALTGNYPWNLDTATGYPPTADEIAILEDLKKKLDDFKLRRRWLEEDDIFKEDTPWQDPYWMYNDELRPEGEPSEVIPALANEIEEIAKTHWGTLVKYVPTEDFQKGWDTTLVSYERMRLGYIFRYLQPQNIRSLPNDKPPKPGKYTTQRLLEQVDELEKGYVKFRKGGENFDYDPNNSHKFFCDPNGYFI